MSNALDYNSLIEERIYGVVYMMARPHINHIRVQGNIYRMFENYFEKNNRNCEAIFENEIKIKNNKNASENKEEHKDKIDKKNKKDKIDTFVPDVLVYCYDCESTKDENNQPLPLIIVEVLSKSTRKKDLTVKMKRYAELGIKEYWIADYKNEIMDIYLLNENGVYDWVKTCGINDEEDYDEDEENNDESEKIVEEFYCETFKDLKVCAKDVFKFAKRN